MKNFFQTYYPDILKIFSTAVFCVYSWSVLILLWDLPALFFYLSPQDIIGYAAYQFIFALGGSLISTLFIASLVFLLPMKRTKSNLGRAGSLLLVSFAISAVLFRWIYQISSFLTSTFMIDTNVASQTVIGLWIYVTVTLPVLSIILVGNKHVASLTDKFTENTYVITTLYALLGILGGIIVFFRNI